MRQPLAALCVLSDYAVGCLISNLSHTNTRDRSSLKSQPDMLLALVSDAGRTRISRSALNLTYGWPPYLQATNLTSTALQYVPVIRLSFM